MMKIQTLMLALLLPAATFARIGETPEQMARRYGTPVEVEPTRMTYEKNGFTIFADMHGGKCCSIGFTGTKDINADQVRALLLSNCGPQTWIDRDGPLVEQDRGIDVHRHISGNEVYETVLRGKLLIIIQREQNDKARAARKAAEPGRDAQAVEGF